MRKITTLFTLMLFVSLGVFAQQTRTNPELFRNVEPAVMQPATGNEFLDLSKISVMKSNAAIPSYGDTVGYTWYDLQTNQNMQNRIFQDASGNIQVIWTKALDTIRDPANANRGVGYNYYDAGTQSWIPGDSNNANFGLADKRVGWPSIANGDGTNEHIFTHTNRLLNSTKGASAVTAVDLTADLTAGALFYHSYGQGASAYVLYDNGVSLAFARTDDGGATWPIADVILDSVYGTPLRGTIVPDGYDIHAKGDSVAIVTGGYTGYGGVTPNDLVLYLSTDRGATFSVTTVAVFDTINAELDTASGGYTVECPQGDMRVTIGEDSRIHITGGVVAGLTNPGDLTTAGYFPTARGIYYWNSDMPAGFDLNDPADYAAHVLVDSIPDMTTMGSYPTASADFGTYVTGMFAHPTVSEDAAGNLYIAFDGICAGSDNNPFDAQYRRDIYVMKSGDGGMTWSSVKNVASLLFANDVTDGTVGEEAFCVTPKRVQNDLLIFFQHDNYAGTSLQGALVLEQNKLAVLRLDPALISGIDEEIAKESLNIYPNPANAHATVSFESKVNGNTTIFVSNMIGQTVKSVEVDIVKGSNAHVLNISDLNEGIYLVTVGTGANKITQKLVID